jgi:dGTPase
MTLSLARLRFPAGRSRGRRYPEPPHPYRREFQRDRDRVIHTRAFRRLEDKTQVFSSGLSDHFRNRLTHTIEVAQIARTVAGVLELDEDLTEALALSHDIGHPPFAHAGEEELDRQMRRFGDRFDHNLHSLRIVEQFEQRYARFPGLNLTFEVREGIAKHSRDFAPGEFPELDEYLPGLRPPLEAQLIDLADEVAYNTADLDDAYSSHLFDLDEARACVPAFGELFDAIDNQYPGASERIQFQETLRALVNLLVSGLIEGTYRAAEDSGVDSVEAVRALPRRLAVLTPEAQANNAALKAFLRKRVYSSEDLRRERQRSAEHIAELFQFFLDHPDRLPPLYVEEAEERELHCVVCDYIAGMTDGYFDRVYRQMMG